jgi:hypothetical protein
MANQQKEDPRRDADETAAQQQQKQAAAAHQQERQAAAREASQKQVKGPDADPLPMIAQALDRLAPPPPAPQEAESNPNIRQGGLFWIGDRLVNAHGQKIVDATTGDDGKLYGGKIVGELVEGRIVDSNKVVREFGPDEENVG